MFVFGSCHLDMRKELIFAVELSTMKTASLHGRHWIDKLVNFLSRHHHITEHQYWLELEDGPDYIFCEI